MLAVHCGELDLFGVELMGGRDVDHLNTWMLTEGLETFDTRHAKVPLELPTGHVVGICGTDHLNARVAQKGGQHQGECTSQA